MKTLRKISAYALATLMLTALLIGAGCEPNTETSIIGIILFKGTLVGVAVAIGQVMREYRLFAELYHDNTL